MEVIYEGIRLTPAQIVRAAVDEDVHVVGLSILSGSHLSLVPQVVEGCAPRGVDVPVVAGGIIPKADADKLKEAGVAAVFTPKDFELTADARRGRRTRRANASNPRSTDPGSPLASQREGRLGTAPPVAKLVAGPDHLIGPCSAPFTPRRGGPGEARARATRRGGAVSGATSLRPLACNPVRDPAHSCGPTRCVSSSGACRSTWNRAWPRSLCPS
jgi:hypothetical protein